MKYGKSLQELAIEVNRQQNSKRDFLAPTKTIQAYAVNGAIEVAFPTGQKEEDHFAGGLTENGHDQLGQLCGIPSKYYDLMRSHPGLLAHNLQYWLERSSDRRMIRSLDGNVRAILSSKYRQLDNFDLMQAVLPMLNEAGAQIESCEVTEKKLYLKAITHKVQAEVKRGDVVSAGIIVTNSEVGHGSLSVKPLVYRLSCSNGAIAEDFSLRKYHVGREHEMEQIEFSNETKSAEDQAFWLKTRDLVKHTLTEVTFLKIVDAMKLSTEKKIEEPIRAIELIQKKFAFNEAENNDVMKHLINGGDLTSWGLGNAVTRMAQDVESYDRSTELEAIGFEIMKQNWN